MAGKGPHGSAFHRHLLWQRLQPPARPFKLFQGSPERVPYVLTNKSGQLLPGICHFPVWTPSVLLRADALLYSWAGGRYFVNCPRAQGQAASVRPWNFLRSSWPPSPVLSLSPPGPTRPRGHCRNQLSLCQSLILLPGW